jgi:hypothetical protein
MGILSFLRFDQASTWKGILTLLTGIGLFALTDVQKDAIAGAMIALYTALSVILPDKFGKK